MRILDRDGIAGRPGRPGRSASTRRPGRAATAAALLACALLSGPEPDAYAAPGARPAPHSAPAPGETQAASGSRSPAALAAASSWQWPISPRPRVLRRYELEHPYSAGHRGIDLAAPPGAPVLAPADGTVRFAGWVVDRPVLSIDHGGGLVSSFEPVEASVAKGDAVRAGQQIGTVSASIAHAPSGGLHLGARRDGGYLDPLALLRGIPRAVLLPSG